MGRQINSRNLADKHGMLSRDEIDLLQHCVRLLSPNETQWRRQLVVINIGANVGTSSCAILEANPEAFVFSIDINPYPEERENVIACGLDPTRIVRLLGDSAEIGTFFPYRPDMVFVDGGHHDEAVMGDIEAWQSKCKSIMLFHDYHHPNYAEKPGVNLDEIVDEAMADWERIGEARYLVGFKRKKNEV